MCLCQVHSQYAVRIQKNPKPTNAINTNLLLPRTLPLLYQI